MKQTSNRQRMSRVKKVKKELETKDYTSSNEVAVKCMKSGIFGTALVNLGVIKSIDGVWHWKAGEVTDSLVDKIYQESKNLRTGNGSKIDPVVESVPEGRQFDNNDLAKMITNFTEDLHNHKNAFVRIIQEEIVSGLKGDVDLLKIKLFNLRQIITKLVEKSVVSEEVNSSLIDKLNNIETNIKLMSKAA